MESRNHSSGLNQQSQSGRKRPHSKLKSDDDDMQNDTSNTNLKITKMDDADAAYPSKAIAVTLGPVHTSSVPLSAQIQSGQRHPQIQLLGQNNINNNVAQLITQLNNRSMRSDPAIFNHINYKNSDVAQNFQSGGAAGLQAGPRPNIADMKEAAGRDGSVNFSQLAS